MAWKFNEEKLRRMIERTNQLHAALLSVSERRREAVRQHQFMEAEIQRWQDKNPNHNVPVPADMQRRLELLQRDRKRLEQEDKRASERWKKAKAAADPLEEFARDKLGWQPEADGVIRL